MHSSDNNNKARIIRHRSLKKPQLFNRPVNRNKKCQQLASTVRSTQERNRVPLECLLDANSAGDLQTSKIAQLQQAGCNQVIQLAAAESSSSSSSSSMELGHLLTRSGLTYPEVPSKVYHDSFCQLGSSVSLP